MLKICFVGCGRIARTQHARGMQRECADCMQLTACVDTHLPRAQAMVADFGAPGAVAFSDLDDALANGDFDAVDIMVPHHLHEAIATKCFAAKKHVLLEKPMSPTLDACSRILAAAAASGKTFMISEQAQYFPFVLAARELILAGAIGEVHAVRATFKSSPNHDLQVLDGESNAKAWRWIKGQAAGGLVIDGGLHWLRPMRMLAPGTDIEAVCAVTARPLQAMDDESLAFALVRFGSGVLGTFEAAATGAWSPTADFFTVSGSEGELVGKYSGQLLLFNAANPDGAEQPYRRHHPHGRVLRDFAMAVLNGVPPAASAEDSLGDLRAALAIYRSAASGRWESVWNPGDPAVGQRRSNL